MAGKNFLAIILIELLAEVSQGASPKLSNFFKVCSRNDPAINSCIVDSINGARSKLIKGVPELGLEPIDPLPVADLRVEEGQEDFNLRIRVRNASWGGISTFFVTRARVDLERRTMELETALSRMSLRGYYTFGGRLLTFRITGDGDFDSDFTNLNCTHTVDFEEVQINGVTHWRVKKWFWDVQAETLVVDFRNLFQGNKRLGRFANRFINANWRAAWSIYGHYCEREFGRYFADYVNKLFEKIPLSELFTS